MESLDSNKESYIKPSHGSSSQKEVYVDKYSQQYSEKESYYSRSVLGSSKEEMKETTSVGSSKESQSKSSNLHHLPQNIRFTQTIIRIESKKLKIINFNEFSSHGSRKEDYMEIRSDGSSKELVRRNVLFV